MLARIEQVLDEKVRPALRTHDGDIKVVQVEDGVLFHPEPVRSVPA